MKEKNEKFQKLCGHVENEAKFDLEKSNNAINRFFGQTKESVTTCSSDYRATPVLTSNGGWSVDESKHCCKMSQIHWENIKIESHPFYHIICY
jgi:hypothetical protein